MKITRQSAAASSARIARSQSAASGISRGVFLFLAGASPVLIARGTAAAQSGSAGFGIQWVESNPFTTFAWSFGANWTIPQYEAENFSNLFDNSLSAGSYGVPWIALSDISESQTTIDTRLMQPNITINYIDDEPSSSQIAQVASNTAQTRTIRPDLPVLVNATGGAGSSYTTYLSDITSEINPDILSFDNYPFATNGQTLVSPSSNYMANLMDVRTASLNAGIPFFTWVQAYGGGSAQYPSESELRAQVFSAVTAGAKGIGYYSFGPQSGDTNSLLTTSDTPDTLYPVAANINSQLSIIGKCLRDLTSTGVGFIRGTASSSVPSGLSVWSKGTGGDPHLVNAGSDNGAGGNSSQDGLLGFFTDASGQNYFMLTNLYCGASLTSAEAPSTFQLTFDSTVNSLLELDPTTGQADVIPLVDNVLTITLDGGQGELFKYDTGPFVGVPEPGTFVLGGFSCVLLAMRRNFNRRLGAC